jgi:hypothetical protein
MRPGQPSLPERLPVQLNSSRPIPTRSFIVEVKDPKTGTGREVGLQAGEFQHQSHRKSQ